MTEIHSEQSVSSVAAEVEVVSIVDTHRGVLKCLMLL